ncbi:MAG: DUF5057 domain-containing protein [Lachnospiraceae bacterium]|nr:DUF5057 domain-containing protein [Lachnospiraceae bacterium]
MKKSKKFISFALVVVMVASLLSALGFAMSSESVSAASKVNMTYRVIELVPASSSASFGYLVSGQEPINIASYMQKNNSDTFATTLKNAGIGEVSKSGDDYYYTSYNWFVENCLPKTNESGQELAWNVDVMTYTPSQLKEALKDADFVNNTFNMVDLFVFTEAGSNGFPSVVSKIKESLNAGCFPMGYDEHGHESFKACTEFDWKLAYQIFKKIAGADGVEPSAYIFDYNTVRGIVGSEQNADKNANVTANIKYFYGRANGIETSSLGEQKGIGKDEQAIGATNNFYKLFAMTTRMNPSTFYSLYFKNADDWYGIDPETGALKAFEPYNGNAENYAALGRLSHDAWGEKMLEPNFLENGYNVYNVKQKLGWVSEDYFRAQNGKLEIAFYNSNQRKSQRGLVYRNDNGLLNYMGSMKDNIATIIKENTYPLDSQQYRFLVVQPNGGGNVNQAFIQDFIAKSEKTKDGDFTYSCGLVGGIKLDVMSMYQFVNTNINLKETYDAIYFGAESSNGYDNIRNSYGVGTNYIYYTAGKEVTLYYENLDWASTGSNPKKTILAGNDLTKNKKDELLAYCSTYGLPVIYSEALVNAKNNGNIDKTTNMYSFIDTIVGNSSYKTIKDNGSDGLSGDELKSLTDILSANKLALSVLSAPPAYESQYSFSFMDQNASNDYRLNGIGAKEPTFVNSGSDKSRKLTFRFKVNGGGKVKAYLYLDMNYDGIFQEGDPEDGGELYESWGEVASDGSVITRTCSKLPNDYVGAITWKLVVKNTETNKYATQIGYSAAKKDDDDQVNKTVVLQIVPTSESSKWGNGEYNSNITGYTSLPQGAVLLLPTKDEIAVAKAQNGNNEITKYDPYTEVSKVQNYFKDALRFDTVTYKVNTQEYKNKADQFDVSVVDGKIINKYNGNVVSEGTVKYNQPVDKFSIYSTAGVYYYFLAKQKDYDMDTYRLSVAKFNELVAGGYITYDSSKKVLKYNRKQTKVEGQTITELDTYEVLNIDMLVLGFCESMDLFSADARSIIQKYIKDDNNAFVGFGAITVNTNNTLAESIRAYMGMDRYNVTGLLDGSAANIDALYKLNDKNSVLVGKDGFTYMGANNLPIGNGSTATINMVNEGTVTHYPYSTPAVFRLANAHMQPFQLNLEDPGLVTYYSLTVGDTYKDARNQYYMYKKGGLTYCAFGFNEGNSSGQKAIAMKLPEAALFVNTIISNTETNPTTPELPPAPLAEVKPINPDVETTPPVINKDTSGNDVKTTDAYLYVYYDATKSNNGNDNVINDGTSTIGGSVIRAEFTAIVSEGTTGKLTFQTTTGKDIPLTIYTAEGTPVTDGIVQDGKNYYVDIPLEDSYYAANPVNEPDYAMTKNNEFTVRFITSTLDNDDNEKGKTVVNMNLVKRGMFTIN